MSSHRWYRLLLIAFPAPLRERHGDDMAQLFADRCREAQGGVSALRGRLRVAALWLLALRDAVANGLLPRIGGGASPHDRARRSVERGAVRAGGRATTGFPRGPRPGSRRPERESLAAVALYDLRHAARSLLAAPGFAVVALLTLALGIGASTALFTLVNALLLRPLPVADPERLVQVTMDTTAMGFDASRLTNPLWEALRDRQRMFDGAFATADVYFEVEGEERAERVRGAWVSGAYFETLGLAPATGRLIGPADDRRGCPAIAVLGHGYWQRRFGGADVVGRTLSLDGQPFQIVGVVQAGYRGMVVEAVTQVYAPLCAEAVVRGEYSALDAARTWWVAVIGRRPPGVDIDAIRAEIRALAPQLLSDAVPADWDDTRRAQFLGSAMSADRASTGFSGVRDRYRESLLVLLGAVGVVMLVVCGNLANLLLARAARRRREVAMRVALGASGRRLLGQFLTESLLLAALGAVAGVIVAHWASRTLVALISPPDGTLPIDIGLDLRVLLFAIVVTLGTGLLFGLAPAIQASRIEPRAAMRGGTRRTGGMRLRAGGTLVAFQVTLSLILLTGAALLVGTLVHLETLDPGFDRNHVLLVDVDIGRDDLEREQRRTVFVELLDRLRALPGVRAASFTEMTPLSGNSVTEFLVAAGYRSLLEEDAEVHVHRVGDGYFASLGIPLRRGRDLTADDRAGSEPVAVVSESMARLVFGGVDVVGWRFHRRMTDTEVSEPIRVVGVVGDAKYRSLRDEDIPTVYFALRQQPWFGRSSPTYQLLVDGDAASAAAMARATVAELGGGASAETDLLAAQLSASLSRERLMATISAFFGGLTLLLAVIGLYGVMSFHVVRRYPEIGVRLALGSTGAGVFALVLRRAAGPVLAGLVVGIVGSLAAVRTIASFAYGLDPYDLRLVAAVTVALASAAMLSAAIPARRAARLDPAVVLRQDAE